MSTRDGFNEQKHCPVVERVVKLHGVRVTLGVGPTEVVQENCSELSDCVTTIGPVEKIGLCLFHTLR